MIAEIPRQPQSLAGLKVSWLVRQSRSGRFCIELFNGQGGIAVPRTKTHQAGVQLAKQRQSRLAERKDSITSHDRFLHAVEGQALTRRELTKPIVAELIQRNCLHIKVELGNGT